MKNFTAYKQRGYVLLATVIVLGAIGFATAVSLLLFGLNTSTHNLSTEQSLKSRVLAQACTETALNSLQNDAYYTGNESLNIDEGTCEILNIENSENVYTIKSLGLFGDTYRKVKVEAERVTATSTYMQINSWQEVADF